MENSSWYPNGPDSNFHFVDCIFHMEEVGLSTRTLNYIAMNLEPSYNMDMQDKLHTQNNKYAQKLDSKVTWAHYWQTKNCNRHEACDFVAIFIPTGIIKSPLVANGRFNWISWTLNQIWFILQRLLWCLPLLNLTSLKDNQKITRGKLNFHVGFRAIRIKWKRKNGVCEH